MISDLTKDLSGGVESRHAAAPRHSSSASEVCTEATISGAPKSSMGSGSSAPPAQNILPVPVLAEPLDGRAPETGNTTGSRSGEARESTTKFQTESNNCEQQKYNSDSRGGQKHLPANRRAKLRELRSRVRILQKAFVRTRSIACADLYRKAIKVARGDIVELGESYD